jgi:hypothetical protein
MEINEIDDLVSIFYKNKEKETMKEKIKDIVENLDYYIVYKPTNLYKRIRSWFWHNWNKDHWKTVKDSAFNNWPFDHGYLYSQMENWFDEAIRYYSRQTPNANADKILKDLRIAKYLLGVINDKIEIFTYDREVDKSGKVKMTYRSLVKVNERNARRFQIEKWEDGKYALSGKSFYSFPSELYKEKARHLFHKIMLERSFTWWD